MTPTDNLSGCSICLAKVTFYYAKPKKFYIKTTTVEQAGSRRSLTARGSNVPSVRMLPY
jgi:hypothetical protein